MDPYYNTPPLPTEAYEPWESPPPNDRFATPEEALPSSTSGQLPWGSRGVLGERGSQTRPGTCKLSDQ